MKPKQPLHTVKLALSEFLCLKAISTGDVCQSEHRQATAMRERDEESISETVGKVPVTPGRASFVGQAAPCMTNHGSKLGMGKRLDNSNSQHHGRMMFATKFVLIYRRPLGEH